VHDALCRESVPMIPCLLKHSGKLVKEPASVLHEVANGPLHSCDEPPVVGLIVAGAGQKVRRFQRRE
jgi:hypothetical protein